MRGGVQGEEGEKLGQLVDELEHRIGLRARGRVTTENKVSVRSTIPYGAET